MATKRDVLKVLEQDYSGKKERQYQEFDRKVKGLKGKWDSPKAQKARKAQRDRMLRKVARALESVGVTMGNSGNIFAMWGVKGPLVEEYRALERNEGEIRLREQYERETVQLQERYEEIVRRVRLEGVSAELLAMIEEFNK